MLKTAAPHRPRTATRWPGGFNPKPRARRRAAPARAWKSKPSVNWGAFGWNDIPWPPDQRRHPSPIRKPCGVDRRTTRSGARRSFRPTRRPLQAHPHQCGAQGCRLRASQPMRGDEWMNPPLERAALQSGEIWKKGSGSLRGGGWEPPRRGPSNPHRPNTGVRQEV